jgi:kynurenine 3-monooxygenase
LIDKHGDDWGTILNEYDQKRKPNGDAVLELALMNFVEMRDKVAEPSFLERKKIEKELGKRYPEKFVSVYEMVSFTHTPYNTAWSCIKAQDKLLGTIMSSGDFFTNINDTVFCSKLDNWVSDYHNEVKQLDFGHEA